MLVIHVQPVTAIGKQISEDLYKLTFDLQVDLEGGVTGKIHPYICDQLGHFPICQSYTFNPYLQ